MLIDLLLFKDNHMEAQLLKKKNLKKLHYNTLGHYSNLVIFTGNYSFSVVRYLNAGRLCIMSC